MNDTVLVTGATGFIAQHCALQLIEAGYRVRGTARSADRGAEVAAVLEANLSAPARDRLSSDFAVVVADLTADDGWAEAVKGCRFVLHVASPFPRTPPRNPDDLIVPAREGVLRVLKAACEAAVERVVLTSSLAAVMYGQDHDHVFDENDWSNTDDPRIGAYEKSKTLAERAAWEFIAALGSGARTELVAINPGLVLGPLLSNDWGTSGELVKKILDNAYPAVPDINFTMVDVRDVAAAHLAAMTVPEAAGQRFVCAEANHSMREVAQILADRIGPYGFRIATRKMPDFVMRFVALFDRTARLALNNLGVRQEIDNSRIRTVLNWTPRGAEEMVVAMAESMIDLGVVAPKP
ncbi:MAG: aldehyde reductase [Actinobacteria bacterium]|nr:aldehyde reductase [Actinomycetota bacterium]